MSFLDRIFKALGGSASGSAGGAPSYWVYAQCQRCGEPLKARIDLRNDLSLADESEGYVVRKGLVGSGGRRCFQAVEVTLQFDAARQQVVASEVTGGRLISAEEYQALLSAQQAEAEAVTGEEAD